MSVRGRIFSGWREVAVPEPLLQTTLNSASQVKPEDVE